MSARNQRPTGQHVDKVRPKGALSLDTIMHGKKSTHVPLKKIIAKKDKRRFVTKFKRDLRRDGKQKQGPKAADRPAFYDEIFSDRPDAAEIKLIPEDRTETIGEQNDGNNHGEGQLVRGGMAESAKRAAGEGKKGKKVREKAKKADPFARERAKYLAEKEERERQAKELEEHRRQRREQLNQSRHRRAEQTKKLQQRTKKGQPILANQIEHLLSKLHKG